MKTNNAVMTQSTIILIVLVNDRNNEYNRAVASQHCLASFWGDDKRQNLTRLEHPIDNVCFTITLQQFRMLHHEMKFLSTLVSCEQRVDDCNLPFPKLRHQQLKRNLNKELDSFYEVKWRGDLGHMSH